MSETFEPSEILKHKVITATTSVIFIYLYFLIILTFFESSTPELNFLRELNIKILLPIVLLCSVLIVLIYYILVFFSRFASFEKLNKLIGITYLNMYRFNSFFLMPLFLFGLGFALITFAIFNDIFFYIGIFLFYLGSFLFLIVLIIKNHYENKIHCMLQMSINVLDILSEKKDTNSINKFNKYFKKSINNIDYKLGKNLKIDELKIDGNNPLRVKNIIINYLPLYIKFGNKEDINSLKNHIKSMSLLVDKKDNFNLDVISVIIDIHKDINAFFDSNKMIIEEKGWHINLSIIKDNASLIFGSIHLILVIAYLYLNGPTLIS